MIITSKQNNIIKLAKQLQTKKFVELFGKCFLETEKIIVDANIENIEFILVGEQSAEKYKSITNNKETYVISKSICKFLSQTESGSDIFAIYKLNNSSLNENKNSIILDSLQDPTNLGAIIRSCLAFDFCNLIAIDSVFPYTYKVIRSSMGYIFKVNFISMKKHEFIEYKKTAKFKMFVADMNGKDISAFKIPEKPFALVIGNEGEGVSEEIKKISDGTISIAMKNGVESLNAAVSASILMHDLRK